MQPFIQLSLISLIPIIASASLIILGKKKKINFLSLKNQIILGILFSIITILGSELGVSFSGVILNLRDAATLCGGLIFGPLVGIIAGIIGGLERWFAIYWGAGTYTRLACSISTATIGIIGGILRKKMFNDNIPPVFSSLVLSIIAEVFHMMMVFITNLDDPINAFSVVRSCSILMILVNSSTVTISVLLSRLIIKGTFNSSNENKHLSDIFNKGVGMLILVAFIATSLFNYRLQNAISQRNCENDLQLSQKDIITEIDNDTNVTLLTKSLEIFESLNLSSSNLFYDTNSLIEICHNNNVTDISIINDSGIIVASSEESFIGYDMSSGQQSAEFLILLQDKQYFIQDYQPLTKDASILRKYIGIAISDGGFIQVGFDSQCFYDNVSKSFAKLAQNRHVNNSGYIIIVDKQLNIVSDYFGNDGKKLVITGIDLPNNFEFDTIYSNNIYGVESYYMISNIEGYYIISTVAISEMLFERDFSVYLNTFLELLVFGVLFVQIYFLIKRNISNNIIKVNNSLMKITTGNLDEVVNVVSNHEFENLSNGINETVKSLKFYIQEAEKRIENELQYAKEIQLNSLPSIFPPFPGVVEFDIYATMNAAKEVGGDFYDFYMENDHKLAFVVADVSGKGVPAALFMMKAKALIKTYVSIGISPADVLINVNYNLYEGNEAGMFVTCFLAYLNTITGVLEVANAGHNPPCIKHKNSNYEFLKVKSGFVLGGMEGMVYKDVQIQLEEGDEIFLYTDGVTEATNLHNELFSESALLKSLSKCKNLTSKEICANIKHDVDEFVGNADQFDDITMLSLRFIKKFNR